MRIVEVKRMNEHPIEQRCTRDGGPHHVIFPHQIHEARTERVVLKRFKTVDTKIVAWLQPQSQMERFLFFIFVVHALQEKWKPPNARLAQHKSESRVAVKSSGI